MKPIATIILLKSFWLGWSQQNTAEFERLYFHVTISNDQNLKSSTKKEHTIASHNMASDTETKITNHKHELKVTHRYQKTTRE